MTELVLQNVSLREGVYDLLKGISLSFAKNELVAIIGPNGAGKSTLLKVAMGLIQPTDGIASINGQPAFEIAAIDRAKAISYLPQQRSLAWPLSVKDVVALGRYAFGTATTKLSPTNRAAIDKAMADCGLTDFAHRRTDQLSGGELARVHCARAFVANAPMLIADEPIAALDPSHQFSVLELIRNYVDKGARAVVVLHDLAQAARFADRLIYMSSGKIVTDGTVKDTLTPENIRSVFNVDAMVWFEGDTPTVTITGTASL